jgi:hypothetical protein
MWINKNQPLGLPTGSVRAILALLVVAPIAVLALKSGITLSGDQFVGLASLVLLAYFANKPVSN